jgi:hypothetical protein
MAHIPHPLLRAEGRKAKYEGISAGAGVAGEEGHIGVV